MNILVTKWPAFAVLCISWLVIFWINFAAELSLMMHLLAVPALLISTAVGALKMMEQSDNSASGD